LHQRRTRQVKRKNVAFKLKIYTKHFFVIVVTL